MTLPLWLCLSAALAAEPDTDPHPQPHTLVAARGLVCLHCSPGHLALGGGAFVEHSLVPDRLSIEVALGWIRGGDHTEVLLEGLLKRPFALGSHLELSPGVGGLVAALPEDGRWVPGALANADLFWWGRHDTAVLLEVDGVVLFESAPLGLTEVGAGVARPF